MTDDEDDRERILKRRAYFVRAALASAGVSLASMGCDEEPRPSVCLSPVTPPTASTTTPPSSGLDAAPSDDAAASADAAAPEAGPDAGQTSAEGPAASASAKPPRPPPPRPQPCLSPRPCLKIARPDGDDPLR